MTRIASHPSSTAPAVQNEPTSVPLPATRGTDETAIKATASAAGAQRKRPNRSRLAAGGAWGWVGRCERPGVGRRRRVAGIDKPACLYRTGRLCASVILVAASDATYNSGHASRRTKSRRATFPVDIAVSIFINGLSGVFVGIGLLYLMMKLLALVSDRSAQPPSNPGSGIAK